MSVDYITLTLDERDAIDTALHQLRGCRALARHLIDIEEESLIEEDDRGEAASVVADAVESAIASITASLQSADVRQEQRDAIAKVSHSRTVRQVRTGKR
jgi:hypothetical protein